MGNHKSKRALRESECQAFNTSTIESLAEDVLLLISSYLNVTSFGVLARVNKWCRTCWFYNQGSIHWQYLNLRNNQNFDSKSLASLIRAGVLRNVEEMVFQRCTKLTADSIACILIPWLKSSRNPPSSLRLIDLRGCESIPMTTLYKLKQALSLHLPSCELRLEVSNRDLLRRGSGLLEPIEEKILPTTCSCYWCTKWRSAVNESLIVPNVVENALVLGANNELIKCHPTADFTMWTTTSNSFILSKADRMEITKYLVFSDELPSLTVPTLSRKLMASSTEDLSLFDVTYKVVERALVEMNVDDPVYQASLPTKSHVKDRNHWVRVDPAKPPRLPLAHFYEPKTKRGLVCCMAAATLVVASYDKFISSNDCLTSVARFTQKLFLEGR